MVLIPNSIVSAVTHKLNVSRHMLIWTFFLVLVCGTRAKNSSTAYAYTICKEPYDDMLILVITVNEFVTAFYVLCEHK
jgi:hypothetical protein